MKIAIASIDNDLRSQISSISGRAPYYLIFDNKKLVKTIKNPFRIGGGGAGMAVAQMLADENVSLVIAGKFGDKMKPILSSNKIKFQEMNDLTVEEVVNKY